MREKLKDTFREKWKEWQQKSLSWWSGLAMREKQAVTIGGIALGIFIFYVGIWSPYVNHMNVLRARIASDQKTLQWMQATDKTIQKLESQEKNKNKPVSAVVLLGILQKQTEQAGLAQYMSQLKQSTNDTIEIHFQKVEFDSLIKLLATLTKAHNISISQMSAVAEGTPGIVNVDIIIKIG